MDRCQAEACRRLSSGWQFADGKTALAVFAFSFFLAESRFFRSRALKKFPFSDRKFFWFNLFVAERPVWL